MTTEFFDEIGRAVDARWTAAGRTREQLCDAAASVLEEIEPPDELSSISILRNAIGRSHLDALGPDNFGQPPLTLYRAPDFYVSALFWMDATTSIHQHAFSGAFRVLVGSSVHCEYGFESRETLDERLLIGDLTCRTAELLGVGATRRIASGPAFIHSLFHLEQPSVTLVVRTPSDAATQFEYARPGVAWDPFFRDAGLHRQLTAIRTLHHVAPAEAVLGAIDVLSRADPWLAFLTVHHWLLNIGPGRGLDWLLDHVTAKHRVLGEALRPSFDEVARCHALVVRRRETTDAKERFELALEMNLPDEASRATLRAKFQAAAARSGQ